MKHFVVKILAALLGIISSLSAASAQEPSSINNAGLDPALSLRLEQTAKSGMKNYRTPGLAVGIVKAGKLVWSGYFGCADLAKKKPVGEKTVFQIASVSKTFTALGLMQQMERGKSKVDDPINSRTPYPVFRPAKQGCREVTFMDVFTHRSGGGELMSYRQLGRLVPTALLLPGQERPPLAKIFTDGIRPRVCPGTKYAYCNFCVGSLGLALEQLSGESFADYEDRHILGPLGMNSSHFYETESIKENQARGYSYSVGYLPVPFMRVPSTPMGGMYSTVPDMARYIMMLLNKGSLEGTVIVKPETIDYMFTPHYQADDRLGKIGINFFIRDFWGHKVAEHSGANPGYGTQLFVLPDDDLGMIVFANTMNSSAYEIAAGMLKILLNAPEPARDFTEAKEFWPGFEGSYGSAEPEFLSDFRFYMRNLGVYRVRVKKDGLYLESLRPGKINRLRQVKKDDPYFCRIVRKGRETPAFLVFTPGENGKIKSIKIDLNEYLRLEGQAKTKAYAKAMLLQAVPEIF